MHECEISKTEVAQDWLCAWVNIVASHECESQTAHQTNIPQKPTLHTHTHTARERDYKPAWRVTAQRFFRIQN